MTIQTVAIYGVLVLLAKYLPENIIDLFSIRQSVAYFPFFMSGTIIAQYDLSTKAEQKGILLDVYTCSLLLIIIAFLFSNLKNYSVLSNLHGLTSIAIIILLCCLMIMRKNFKSIIDRYLEFLGKRTLDIYVYHYFIVLSLHLEFFSNWFNKTGNEILEVFFCGLLSILVSYISVLIGKIVRRSNLLAKIVYGELVTYSNGKVLLNIKH